MRRVEYDELEVVRWVGRSQYVLSNLCDCCGDQVCFIAEGGYRREECPRLVLLYDCFRCREKRIL